MGVKKPFTYDGIEYDSLEDCCKELGLVVGRILYYVYRYKCTKQEAVDYYLNKKGFFYNGKRYKNVKDCCEKLGFNFEAIYGYKKSHNCTYEETIDHYVNRQSVIDTQELFTNEQGITYYQAKCTSCNRFLILTQEEKDNFQHSTEFCKEHILDF